MAVAAGEAQAAVLTKDRMMDGGRAIHTGVLSFGNSYPTGGSALASDASQRLSLPAQIDVLLISSSSGYNFEYVPGATPKVKAYVTREGPKHEPQEELANAKDISAVKATFIAIGIA